MSMRRRTLAFGPLVVASVLVWACGQRTESPQQLKNRLETRLTKQDDAGVLEIATLLMKHWQHDSALTTLARADSFCTLAVQIYLDDRFGDIAGLDFLFDAAAEDILSLDSPDPELGYDILSTCASFAFNLYDFDQAVELESAAFDLLLQSPEVDSFLVAQARIELSKSFTMAGQASSALDLLQPLLTASPAQAIVDTVLLADLWIVAGEAHRLAGQHGLGQRYANEAVRLIESKQFRASADYSPEMNVTAIINQAGTYYDRGELARARVAYQRAGSIAATAEATVPASLRLLITMNLAEIARLQHRNDVAEELFTAAFALADSASLREDFAFWSTLAQFGMWLADSGKTEQALDYFELAERLLDGFGSGGRALSPIVLLHKADLLRRIGRLDDAIVASKMGLDRVAEFQGDESLEAAVCRAKLGICLTERGDKSIETRKLLESAIGALARAPTYPEVRADAMLALAKLDWSMDDKVQAINAATRALDSVEFLRSVVGSHELVRARYFEEYVEKYALLSRWLFDEGRTTEAFDTSEKARARALLEERIRQLGPVAKDPDEIPMYEELAQAQTRYSETRARVMELTRKHVNPSAGELADAERACLEAYRQVVDAQGTVTRLAHRKNENFGFPKVASPLRWLVESGLAGDQCYIAWHIGATTSSVWLVDGSTRNASRLELTLEEPLASYIGSKPREPLRREHLRQAILGSSDTHPVQGIVPAIVEHRKSVPTDVLSALYGLYRSLVPEKIHRQLEQARTVLAVVDDAVAAIPIQAWVVHYDGDNAPKYWIDSMPAVRYVPSASYLQLVESQTKVVPNDDGTIVAVGGVKFSSVQEPNAMARSLSPRTDRNNFRPLPGTKTEVEAIVRTLAPRRVLVFSGGEATEANLRRSLPGASLLHLATHGLVEQRGLDTSAAIALAPSVSEVFQASDDGFLDLHEIPELRLVAELVVLSACESGRGEIVAGEGTYALSRAFLSAGASGVVHSQWIVSDAATALLMQRFYAAWSANSSPRESCDFSAALRRAQLAVKQRSEFASPFYWAPFVYTGQ